VADIDTINKTVTQLYQPGAADWHGDKEVVTTVAGMLQELPPAADEALLSALDWAPTSKLSREEILELADGLETMLDRLNQEYDLPEDLMALILKLFQQLRRSAFQTRLDALQAAKQDQLNQADMTRKEAAALRQGAITSVALGSVAAAVGLGAAAFGGFKAFKAGRKLTAATTKAEEINRNTGKLNKLNATKRRRELNKGFHEGKQRVDKAEEPEKFQAKMDEMQNRIERREGRLGNLQREMSDLTNKSQELNNVVQAANNLNGSVGGGLNAGASAAGSFAQSEGKGFEATSQEYSADATGMQSRVELAKKVCDDFDSMTRAIIQYLRDYASQEPDRMRALTSR
jgi:hypothetical protein